MTNAASTPDVAIETTGLTRTYGTRTAVDHIDLSIRRGELFALLGPNGAGKTTTIRMLCCLTKPTSGTASVGGHDVRTDPLAVKELIAVAPQETAIAEHLDAWENLELMAGLHDMQQPEARRRSEELIEVFGLTDRADERAKRYSGGLQRRLSLAMALVSDPRILFLDEPTLGLDPQSRRQLWEHIERLKGTTTIVLTTHYLEEADALADRIAVIDDGTIIADGTADELKRAVPGGRSTVVEANITEAAFEALTERYRGVRRTSDGVEIDDERAGLEEIVDLVRPHGVTVRSAHRPEITLDDVFVHLTGKELRT